MGFSGFKVPGLGALQSAMTKVRDQADATRDKILDQSAEILVGEAKQQERCPYLTGALADSHTWTVGPKEATRLIGANTTYAAAVHANHATKARWLLIAVVDLGPGVLERVTQKVLKEQGFS